MNASRKLTTVIFALLFITVIETRGQEAGFYLKDGDRVVFYGDSITEQNLYTAFVETYTVTRFPRLNVSFINAGWSGDKVIWDQGPGGTVDERLRRDVFPHKPTVLTIMLGMNDGFYVDFNPTFLKAYSDGYEKLLALLKANLPQLRITLMQPSPFDDLTAGHAWRLAAPPIKDGYNSVMVRYGKLVDELARQRSLNVADMNAPVVEVIRKAQATDPGLAQKIIPDRIHPAPAGHWLMAAELLKAWHAPATVSKVELDAASGRIVRSERTKIVEFKIGDVLSWTQNDDALPLPLDMKDEVTALVMRLSDVLERLDQQILKVGNLSAERYTLKIDGDVIGAWTKQELASGINLAPLPTPMLRQALAVHALTLQHNRIHFVRWRELQVPFSGERLSATPKAIETLDALEDELVKRQHAAALPFAHRYELIAQH